MLVSFYKLTPGGRAPVRADRSVAGTLPVRALRYCEAVCTASALGYYVFPPLDLTIEWDGTDGGRSTAGALGIRFKLHSFLTFGRHSTPPPPSPVAASRRQ